MAPDHRTPHALGRHGEQLACDHLRALGFRILARNLRVPPLEIDLVALERRTLCFVEVRTRSGSGFGTPEESIDARKRARLLRAARAALARGGWPHHERVRFDVVAVDASRDPPALRLIRDAVYDDSR